jgi:aldehyde dehydrogenase (NAD+)
MPPVPIVCKAIVQNTGQTCSAGSRVLVQKSVYDEFVGAVAKQFQAAAGTPEMDLDCGPVINAKQRGRVQSFIDQARERASRAGRGADRPGRAQWRLLRHADPVRPRAARQPAGAGGGLRAGAVGLPFEDEDDAIKLANATDYGLVAAVWTKNGGRQQRVSRRVPSGQVFINGYGAGGGIELPFGGTGKSGHGREKGFIALEEMSTTKTVVHYYK